MAILAPNHPFIQSLREALGLAHLPAKRYVIDLPAEGVPLLYTEGFVSEEAFGVLGSKLTQTPYTDTGVRWMKSIGGPSLEGVATTEAPKITYAAGVLQALKEALGLGDKAIRRAVIDIRHDSEVQVYLEEGIPEEPIKRLAKLLEDFKGELPLSGFVWVDRIGVGNDGGMIVLRGVKDSLTGPQLLVRQMLEKLRFGTPEQQKQVIHAIYDGE